MFILILHYNAPIEEINKYMEAHKAYLNKHYASGRFIASGRQNPPTSDIILCRASDIREAEHIISQDPFVLVGDYQIIAFTPNRIAHGFEQWLSTMN